ncbi:MAG: Sec-independent protein translocase protein TatB [Alphaproteobacteria bacterium]
MLDIGWSEMVVLAVIVLIVVGPKELPRMLRVVGRWAGKARATAREFQSSIDNMIREAELDEVKKGVEQVGRVNPKKEIEKAIDPTGSLSKAVDLSEAEGKGDGSAASAASAEEAGAGASAGGEDAAKPKKEEESRAQPGGSSPSEHAKADGPAKT